jgi:hypothetical protein
MYLRDFDANDCDLSFNVFRVTCIFVILMLMTVTCHLMF